MADVIQKAITGNSIKNGSSTAGVDKKGNKQVLNPDIIKAVDVTGVDARYDGRFDDIRYYTSGT